MECDVLPRYFDMIAFNTECMRSFDALAHAFSYKMFQSDRSDCVCIIFGGAGWWFILHTFTTINKQYNAEVTCIPNESSCMPDVIVFLSASVFFLFFFAVGVSYCSVVTCHCNFDCFFAVALMLRFMHYLHIFHFLFHIFEIWTRATDENMRQLNWINREILTSNCKLFSLSLSLVSMSVTVCLAFHLNAMHLRAFQIFLPLLWAAAWNKTIKSNKKLGLAFVYVITFGFQVGSRHLSQ